MTGNPLVDVFLPPGGNSTPPTNYRWGIVSGWDGNRCLVHLDGDFDSEDNPVIMPAAVQYVGSTPRTGDRVLVLIHHLRATILGVLSPFTSVIGPEGSTSESTLQLWRVVGGSQMKYLFQAGISEQANIIIQKDGESHSIFRVGRDGQLAMQTYAVSGSGNATRPLPFAMATGSVVITGTGSAGGVTAAITFPSGRFTSAPLLFATARTFGEYIMASVAATPTTSGGTVRLTNTNGAAWSSSHTVYWLAVQLEA